MAAPALFLMFHSAAEAVVVGQSEKDALAELGEPAMRTSLGPKGVLWGYKHGSVVICAGKVVKVDFRTPEQIKAAEREEAASRERQSLEDRKKAAQQDAWAKAQRARAILDERALAYFKNRQALIFNRLVFQPDSSPPTVGIANLAFLALRREEQFIPLESSGPRGDSMQSVGGGGGVGLGGNAGTIIPAQDYVCIDFDMTRPGGDFSAVTEVRFSLVCTINGKAHQIVAPISSLRLSRSGEPDQVHCRGVIEVPGELLPADVIAHTDKVIAVPCLLGGEIVSNSGSWTPATMLPVGPRPAGGGR